MGRVVQKGKHILRPEQVLRALGYAPEDEVSILSMHVTTDPPILSVVVTGPTMPHQYEDAEAPLLRLPSKKEKSNDAEPA